MQHKADYWDPELETMPPEKLRELQEERLCALVNRVYQKVPFYQKKLNEARIKPEDIKGLADLPRLPVTEYLEDFVATPLEEKLAVPWELITDILSTSGTLSGFTQPVPFTSQDLDTAMNLGARSVRMAGVREEDTIQLLIPFDLFVLALKKVASKVIPSIAGRMMLDNQIKLAKVAGATVILIVPSYLLRFCERAKELGIDLKNDTRLRTAIGAGEPLSAPVRNRIEAESGIRYYDLYGSSEGALIGGDCSQRDGLHIWADHYLLEIIDPDSLKPLSPGEEGELVITTLTKEAMPLIRYRTGDVTRLLPNGHCSCGRTHPKIAPIRGRVDHIIKVQGVNLLPSDIEDFIVGTTELGTEFRIIVDRKGALQQLKIEVELAPGVSHTQTLKQKLEAAFEQATSLKSEIELVPPGALPQTQFKAQRIVKNYE